ncbi:phosphoribosylglycinamide formyltransferase [Telmatospirillum sp.]|uniref:phosphoribosylglycinamide formyltransferase n=1 Tax=Telmatospirillum sp. TaxID=2079197 RepID=UPI00284DE54D|nr:phosphoribosylglycinamide formyltransferase [Telmatospirillum sp.]MDR3438451.1 phosphoribosylglycinamide formyltransferase [Telmatospirillum sp.]
MARLRVAVLISGRGSNLQALLDACGEGGFPAEIVLVLSNRPDAAGLDRARRAGVPTRILDHKVFASREAFDEAMDGLLRTASADLVCLAGFMRLLTPGFVQAWQDRLINIHPSLLPSFKGLHTHRQALDAGVTIHGCTVHFVTADLDAGPILVQAAVPVHPDDDEDSLAARVLEAEHRIYPLALRWLGEGRISTENNRVRVSNGTAAIYPLINPAA